MYLFIYSTKTTTNPEEEINMLDKTEKDVLHPL